MGDGGKRRFKKEQYLGEASQRAYESEFLKFAMIARPQYEGDSHTKAWT